MEMENIYFPNRKEKELKLNFSNIITLDSLSNTEKTNKKYSNSPFKINTSKNMILNRNILQKDNMSDIESTGNSEKNGNKIIINNLNENDNKRYINIKENDDNLNKNENSQNIQVRRDIFGEEIKKGGKHRVSFADNAHTLKARMKIMGNRHSVQLDSPDRKFKKMGLRRSIIGLRNLKYHKQFDSEDSDNKIRKFVEVIEIQSYKSFNKIDTEYLKENIFGDKETLCCSNTCFIY